MSDQGYSPAEETGQSEEEDTVLFCRSWSPMGRKCGYYITFLGGGIVFLLGIIDLIGASIVFLIIGSILMLLCPLWIKSPSAIIKKLKESLKLSSLIIYLVFLTLTFVNYVAIDSDILTYIFGFGLVISGIWYFLSYFENGQEACLACVKTCFKGKEESSGGETGGETA